MPPERCCPYYHRAVELIGRRWSGAIVAVLLEADAARFSEIAGAIPEISDRLLTERLKELAEAGVVTKDGQVYALTDRGRDLAPAVHALQAWARRWLAPV